MLTLKEARLGLIFRELACHLELRGYHTFICDDALNIDTTDKRKVCLRPDFKLGVVIDRGGLIRSITINNNLIMRGCIKRNDLGQPKHFALITDYLGVPAQLSEDFSRISAPRKLDL